MTEEVLLFRTFKYFDVDNSDLVNLDTFLKVIAKVGLLEFSEKELSSLFYYYSNNQKLLNYKDFIGIIFNNESLKKNKNCVQEKYTPPQNQPVEKNEPAQPENNEEIDPIEEYILRIRKKLSTKGLPNLINMETTFRVMDENNEQEIDFNQFCQISQEYDFGLNEQELKELFMDFDRDGVGKINYDDFLRVMRGELSENRKNLVRNLFQTLDKEQKGVISLDELFSLYNPLGSFECKVLNFPPQEAMKYFVTTFSGNHKYLNGDEGVNKPADADEFEDYYESVSIMIPDDNMFRDVLLGSWGLIKDEERQEPENLEQNVPPEVQEQQPPYEQERPEQPYEEPREQREQPYEEQREQREQPQYEQEPPQKQYEQQQEPQPQPETQPTYQEEEYPPEPEIPQRQDLIYAQMKKEKEFRKNLFNEENMDYFRNQLGARGIITVMNFVNQLRQYDRKGNKELSFNDFSDAVSNINLNLTPDDIKDLFNDFADQKNQTLNYANFLNVLVGELNDRRQNIVNVAYKKLDNENCGVINLSDVKEQFNSKNSPIVRDAIMSEEMFFNSFMNTFQTHHNIYRSPKIKKVNFAEFEDYYKYVSLTIDDDYLFEEMIIAAWKLSKTKNAYIGPKDTVKNLISYENVENNNKKSDFKPSLRVFPKHDKVPYGVDDEVTDYSNQLHPKGNLNGIKLNKIDDPLSDFRKKIIVRGPRCITSLRRTFMLYDINKNNKLSFDEFKKFIRDYRFQLNNDEQTKLFKLFDKNNSGDIDYEEFLHAVFGKMNNYRRQVTQRVFEKLDNEKTGKVSFDVIRNSYDADKHPEVLNGTRTQPEILSRFIDLFEYHFNILNQKKEDFVTKDEFLEFYDYLSAFIDDDKYFENLMSRVWDLGETENYTKSFKCIKRKKMF